MKTQTEMTLQELLQSADRPVLVEFWAAWCAPCKAVARVVDEFMADFVEHITVRKIDIDREPETAEQFSIKAVPTFVLFYEGRELARMVGAVSKQKLADFVLEQVY